VICGCAGVVAGDGVISCGVCDAGDVVGCVCVGSVGSGIMGRVSMSSTAGGFGDGVGCVGIGRILVIGVYGGVDDVVMCDDGWVYDVSCR